MTRLLLAALFLVALILFGWVIGYRRGIQKAGSAPLATLDEEETYLVVYRLNDLVDALENAESGPQATERVAFDQIVKVIRANVESEFHNDYAVRPFPKNRSIIVSASPDLHRLTADVLENLRRFPGVLDDIPTTP